MSRDSKDKLIAEVADDLSLEFEHAPTWPEDRYPGC